MKINVLVAFLFLMVISCAEIQRTADAILKPSAREVYERDFGNVIGFKEWNEVYTSAQIDSLSLPLPSVIQGKFNPERKFAYSYNVIAEKGEILHVDVEIPVDTTEVFVDIFKLSPTGKIHLVKSSSEGEKEISKEITENGIYKIIVQPGISAGEAFTLKIYTMPAYGFPVSGMENKSIQSFWGVARDGGNRTHEGVDIFAKRGTPVVAGVDGTIGFTGERGLGGKQVWLRDGLFGNSLYYAHLDSIVVATGTQVKRGDTLGTVGNTGNAKNSPPHLHFGIYEGVGGATNPLAFIKIKEIPKKGLEINKVAGVVSKNGSELRIGPSTQHTIIAELSRNASVYILGKSDKWFHVSVGDSLKGFIHQTLIKL